MGGIVPLKGRVLEVLGRDEILQIHQSALAVLRDVGTKIQHEEGLDIFRRAGAEIDESQTSPHGHY